jgi:deoxyribodipyrimidine photo-lyase
MIIWIHRKDLRVEDLRGFDYLVERKQSSVHLVILDPVILKKNRHLEHSGINFLRHVRLLMEEYARRGRRLYVLYGEPLEILQAIKEHHDVEEIVYHEDYTPYALQRDRGMREWAEAQGIRRTALQDGALAHFQALNDLAGRKEPFKIFTPFYRRWSEWLERGGLEAPSTISISDLHTDELNAAIVERYPVPFALPEAIADSYETLVSQLTGFFDHRLPQYKESRDDYADEESTSGVSRHLNAGAISVRHIHALLEGRPGAETWRRQLAWREFYMYQAVFDANFFTYEQRFDFGSLSQQHFQAWAEARTGVPIVDAALTQLAQTGIMPNRLRMVTAMFLTKNLLCPFTLGETWFRYKLTDYDNALNRGGWLWSSSLGFDGAPYFRIMNPVMQSERFDPTGQYIRRWLPELRDLTDREIHQPRPDAIVDVKESRERAIEVYKHILASAPKEES